MLHRFISTLPDDFEHNEEEEHLKYVINPSGLLEDTYEGLTTKVYLSFKHFYEEHDVKFDWYLKTDDDT